MQPHEIKAFRKSKNLTQSEFGSLCGVGKGSVSDWESGKNSPSGPALKIIEELVSGKTSVIQITDQEAKLLDENVQRGGFDDREDFLTASLVHLIKYGRFATPEELRKIADEGSAIVDFPSSRSVPSPKAHLMAAAGSPLRAEIMDWGSEDDEKGVIQVKAIGRSMEPLIHDGDIVEMRLKRVSRSPYMKKGLIYLVQYDGGYTIKRFNTRTATAEELEMGDEWVRLGKVGVLEPLNPEVPEIIIKQEIEWIAWLDQN